MNLWDAILEVRHKMSDGEVSKRTMLRKLRESDEYICALHDENDKLRQQFVSLMDEVQSDKAAALWRSIR